MSPAVDFFCALGYAGQYVCIYPSLDLVFSMVSNDEDDDGTPCAIMRQVPTLFQQGDDARSCSSSPTVGIAVAVGATTIMLLGALLAVWCSLCRRRKKTPPQGVQA